MWWWVTTIFILLLAGLVALVGVINWSRLEALLGTRPTSSGLVENLKFTVRWPTAVQPTREYKLLAFAHLSPEQSSTQTGERAQASLRIAQEQFVKLQEEVSRRLGPTASSYDHASQTGNRPILRNDTLMFVPRMTQASFDPPFQPFRWKGKLITHEFNMTVEAGLSGKVLRGKMFIYQGMIAIAQIDMEIMVDEHNLVGRDTPTQQAEASPFAQIFVSYAHEDSCIVDHVVSLGPASRIAYLRDRQIPPGSNWRDVLQEYINTADLFQLFWSRNARISVEVENEWRQALLVPKKDFILPVYWEKDLLEDEGGKPKELAHIEFCRLPFTCEEIRGIEPKFRSTAPIVEKAPVKPALTVILMGLLVTVGLAAWASTGWVGGIDENIPPIEGISTPTPVPLPSTHPTPSLSPTPAWSITPRPSTIISPTPSPSQAPTQAPKTSPTPTIVFVPNIRAIRDITGTNVSLDKGRTMPAGIYLHNGSRGTAYDVVLTQDVPASVRVESIKPTVDPETKRDVRRYVLRIKELPAGGRASLELRLFTILEKPAGKEELPMHTLTYKDANGKEYTGQ
jgi:hypothetical protein